MDSVSHLPLMLPAVPVQHPLGTTKVPVGDARQRVGKEPWHTQHVLPPHLSLSHPCSHPSWQAAPAPISHLKGRSAVEFTPAKDWLLLILVTRTRRCGRTDSDIVECDLEGLPAGNEKAGSPAAAWGDTCRQGCCQDGNSIQGPR